MPVNDDSKRKQIKAAHAAMQESRQSFEGHWQDLADWVLPRAYRWLSSDWTSKGNKANKNIIDPTGTLSLRALGAAFSSSITSQSRPWKKLAASDPQWKENYDVNAWLAECDDRLDSIFLRSNFYQEVGKMYEQASLFGTACMLIEEDFKDTVRFETLPCGSYWLGINAKREVDQFCRKFTMTARQLVQKFGEDHVSDKVQDAFDNGRKDSARFDVLHYIGPNTDYMPGAVDSTKKKYYSVYMEDGATGVGSIAGSYNDDEMLRESGYDEFPMVTPRWKTYDDDVYGLDCPGMIALGHIKELQHVHKQMSKAIEKQVNPPLQAPEMGRRMSIETIPGSVNTVENRTAADGIRPLYQVNFDIQGCMMLITNLRDQIKESYFYNLFLMVANERRSGTKAREIEELHEEKLMMLSTAYEQFSQEGLAPCVERVFMIANRLGRIPEPPPEFQGQQFDVEFVSVMAQAMKLVGIGNIDRAIAVIGQIGSAHPEVMDLVNFDRLTTSYIDRLGVDPRLKNSPAEIKQIRDSRSVAIAQQQQIQQQTVQADNAKTLSETKIQDDTALSNLIDRQRGG